MPVNLFSLRSNRHYCKVHVRIFFRLISSPVIQLSHSLVKSPPFFSFSFSIFFRVGLFFELRINSIKGKGKKLVNSAAHFGKVWLPI
jgi:hypothetical protein